MIEVISFLEPRYEEPYKLLYRTIEEVNSIYFIVKGSVEVGFEVNRDPKYVLRLTKGGVFGIYNVTFNKKTMFTYRVKDAFQGFTIRKDNWKSLMTNPEYEDISSFVKF
jgi:hypothetical protein